ncbi:MAG: phenylalanine--tRNA ligase subunit beta [Eubacteriaceae bacterium]|nr:phenylalanine--tRNA ligase subunit beta [Eubacteriaceae bacterium]
MLTPLLWLKDYASIDGSVPEYARKMTLSGTIAEDIKYSKELSGITSAKILSMKRHESSDHLWIVALSGEGSEKTVVTGAQNISVGDIVAHGLPGAILADRDEPLESREILGITSQGMLLSATELGIPASCVPKDAEDGVFVLPKDTPLGASVPEALGLTEATIDFELTNNRQDCNSILGIAAETEACQGREFIYPEYETGFDGDEINNFLNIEIEDFSKCHRYTARMARVIKIEPSPLWMQVRLMASGIRPINNIVDVSNFVMIETGQPLHMFDYAQISEGKIIVKPARKGDAIKTLDGVQRELASQTLMISDPQKHIGIAGIMGALNSEITDSTEMIVIESANFEKTAIKAGRKFLGINSESASRFEKGLSIFLTRYACDRAAGLLMELGAVDLLDGIIDVAEPFERPSDVALKASAANSLLGTNIEIGQMAKLLSLLGIKSKIEGETLTATPPIFRQDINVAEDVIEEIARMYGYENIPTGALPFGAAETPNAYYSAKQLIKSIMAAVGGNEILTYSFLSPSTNMRLRFDDIRKDPIALRNPLGEDNSLMRTSLIHGMLEALSLNFRKKSKPALMFEIGMVYHKSDSALPDQKEMLCFGAYGFEYAYAKSVADYLFESLKISNSSVQRSSENHLHPKRSADIISSDGAKIGYIGQTHPAVLKGYDLPSPVVICEISIDFLAEQIISQQIKAVAAHRYPAIERDLAIVCDEAILAGDISREILASGGQFIKEASVFDVYKSEALGDKKSIAFALAFRSEDRTLVDEDVSAAIVNILKRLEEKFGATLRE